MPAQLVALDRGPSIMLDKPILLLGRHPECDIQIDSRKISRRHCCIAQVSDYLVIRDLGSTNGIRINGLRIVEGQLNAGDELMIGNHRYKVTWDEVSAAAKPGNPKNREPAPKAGIKDEMLESCDEPVALDEPDAQAVPRALPVQSPDAESPPPVKENPLYLPEELGLAPNSNLFRKGSPLASPSGSHHPV